MKKLGILLVPYRVLRELLVLPEGTQILGVRDQVLVEGLEIKVEHPDLKPVPEMDKIPSVTAIFEEKHFDKVHFRSFKGWSQ